MASLHKRRLRSGEVVWELTHGTGADRQRFIAGRTEEEAEGVLRQFKTQIALHGDAPGPASIADAVNKYLDYLRVNRRKSTVRRYGRVLRTFVESFLGQHHPHLKLLRDIKPMHLEDYKRRRSSGELTEITTDRETDREKTLRSELAQAPKAAKRTDNAKYGWLGRKRFRQVVTPRTVNYELRTLATFFGWAVRSNHLFVNPVVLVERFKIPKRALPKFLTSEELRRFFAACQGQDRRLFMTILLSGMRKGEAEHLTWADVSFEMGVIFIQAKEGIWLPKTDERVIPMSQMLHAVLAEHSSQRRDDGLVFPNREGRVDTHILERLKRICRRAGIRPATVHSLRHSFGAHLRMAGVSLADIADLLGHKDLATTQIYAKVQQEHLRSAVGKLAPLVPTTAINASTTTAALLPPEGGSNHGTLATAHAEGEPSGISGADQGSDRRQEDRDQGTGDPTNTG